MSEIATLATLAALFALIVKKKTRNINKIVKL